MESPNYYGILPANIRYCKTLKPMEKIIYAELSALTNKHGYCNAKNSYFAELYEVHKNTVSSWISNLENNGFINVKIIYEDNSKQIIERRIYMIDTYQSKDVEVSMNDDKNTTPINEKIATPINEKLKDNNTRDEYYKSRNNNYFVDEKNLELKSEFENSIESKQQIQSSMKNQPPTDNFNYADPKNYEKEKDWFDAMRADELYSWTIPDLLYKHLIPYLNKKRGRPLNDYEIKRVGNILKEYVGISQLEIVRRCIKGGFAEIKPFGTDKLRKDYPYVVWELGAQYAI